MAKPFVNIELEDRVLRCLLYDSSRDSKDTANEIVSNIGYVTNVVLNTDIFYSAFKQWLFEQIRINYIKHSECIEKNILFEILKKKYKEKDEYENKEILLNKIFKRKFESKAFKNLVEELKDKYNCRTLLDLNMSVNESLENYYLDDSSLRSNNLIQTINDKISKIMTENNSLRIIEEDIFHDIDRDLKLIEDKKQNPEKYKGISTGFDVIDKATGGWYGGELTVVLGRPSMGKSILLLNFAIAAYNSKYNVVYVTIEMPIEQQKNRYYSYITGINYNKIKKPQIMDPKEFEYLKRKIKKEKEKHKNFLYFIDAPENCSTNFLESRVSAFENSVNQRADLLIVDPLYLMQPNDKKVEDKVGSITWDLKTFGRKKNIPVIAASQFNRMGHDKHSRGKEVDTADAAFTDKISYNVDNMIGITGDKQRAKFQFPKTRDSEIKEAFFIKKFERMKFEYDVSADEEEEELKE